MCQVHAGAYVSLLAPGKPTIILGKVSIDGVATPLPFCPFFPLGIIIAQQLLQQRLTRRQHQHHITNLDSNNNDVLHA